MEKIIERVAKISRLELSKDEKKQLAVELSNILEYFEIIDEIKLTAGPRLHPIGIEGNTRKDTPKVCMTRKQALSNSKNNEDGYFVGPSVL